MLKCKICGADIDAHYGELTLIIQPRVIKDGTFWKIDGYMPDTIRVGPVCETCIVSVRQPFWTAQIPGDETEHMVSWGMLYRIAKAKVRTWIRSRAQS